MTNFEVKSDSFYLVSFLSSDFSKICKFDFGRRGTLHRAFSLLGHYQFTGVKSVVYQLVYVRYINEHSDLNWIK